MRSNEKLAIVVLVFVAAGASGATAQAPPNDTCASAYTLYPPHIISGNTTGANTQMTGCASIGADVWFTFTAPYTGTATMSVCSAYGPQTADFDTVIIMRDHFACGFGMILGCNDDWCGTQSHLVASISAGYTYEIQLGGWQGATGNYTLSLTTAPAVPPNDTCATASPIALNNYVYRETYGATTGPDPLPSCAPFGAFDVWYSFVAPACGTYSANTCIPFSTNYSTFVAVWQGSCGALTEVACSAVGCPSVSYASAATFNAVAGGTYLISVGGTYGGYGWHTIIVTQTNPAIDLAYFSTASGNLGFKVTGGPPGGYAFTAMTPVPGNYPAGWFHGVDVTIPEIISLWSIGSPFRAPLGAACGDATHGPFGPLPPGITLYGVSLGFPSGTLIPTTISAPSSGTVP